jgi:uncharacterized membrane protein
MKFAPLILLVIGIVLLCTTFEGTIRNAYSWKEAIVIALILPGMILYSAFQIWRAQQKEKELVNTVNREVPCRDEVII